MKRDLLIILGLVVITVTAFSGVRQCGFVNFDDTGYVVNNPHVNQGLSGTNFAWAWKTYYEGNYIPLSWLSLMLDATLFGPGAQGFHWVNLAFHAANAALVYLFFREATGGIWRSALVAGIFAVHPLRVESVVWIVERKDVLTAFFGLLTMLAYLRYTRELNWKWYAAMLPLFAATLLAKQILATIPCVLLLMDYWPLGRWGRGPAAVGPKQPPQRCLPWLIAEKLPFILMATIILVFTIRAQSQTAMSDFKSVPLRWRLENVPVSYARYLGKMVWFGNLAVFYPRPDTWSVAAVAGSSLLLLGITALCATTLRSRPWLMIGWLWFLGVLVPMIGVLQFGPQAMADRFTYVAGIGLLIMAAWSIPDTVWQQPILTASTIGTILGILIVFTLSETLYWRTSVTLFTRDIEVVGSTPFAELNLGAGLYESSLDDTNPQARDALDAAISHLQKAAEGDPLNPKAQKYLTDALAKK